jgi:hypothetical protein
MVKKSLKAVPTVFPCASIRTSFILLPGFGPETAGIGFSEVPSQKKLPGLPVPGAVLTILFQVLPLFFV